MSIICESKIAILLATYNGAKYIEEQLESLESQLFKDFEVYVHEDFSTDATLDIIKNFAKRSSMQIHILEDVEKRGAMKSFFWLLEQVEASYYMFCDQDDVWLPFKVSESFDKIRELETLNPGKPVMVHTDLRIVDRDLQTIHSSFWGYAGFNVDLQRKFGYACTNNVFTGCTMIINAECRSKSLPYHPKSPMHDWWIGLIATKYGAVDNIKKATILYRQHGSNVESVGEEGSFKFSFGKIFRLMDKYGKNREMLKSLGFGDFKALYYKILYTLHRIKSR